MEQNTAAPTSVEETVSPVMDTPQQAPNASLTLKEKYFQIEPEGRIRRYQYFIRSLVPGIILFFTILGGTIMVLPIMMFLGEKVSSILGLLIMGGIYWVFYNLAKVNSVKRAHDFGSDGKIAVYIVTASFAMSIIWLIVWVLQGLGVLPTADIWAALQGLGNSNSEDPMAALKLMSEAMKNATPLYERLLGYVSNVISIASVVAWFVLLFRPGVAWDNQYGKDASKNPVSFLG